MAAEGASPDHADILGVGQAIVHVPKIKRSRREAEPAGRRGYALARLTHRVEFDAAVDASDDAIEPALGSHQTSSTSGAGRSRPVAMSTVDRNNDGYSVTVACATGPSAFTRWNPFGAAAASLAPAR